MYLLVLPKQHFALGKHQLFVRHNLQRKIFLNHKNSLQSTKGIHNFVVEGQVNSPVRGQVNSPLLPFTILEHFHFFVNKKVHKFLLQYFSPFGLNFFLNDSPLMTI